MQQLMVAQRVFTDPPEWIKWIIGWIVSGCMALLGGWDMPLKFMFTAQVCNHIFGVGAAIKTGEGFKPKKLAEGVGVSVLYWVAVVVAFNVDQYLLFMGQALPANMQLHDAVVLGFFLADTASTLTNAALCGVPIPTKFTNSMAKLKGIAAGVTELVS